MTQHLLKFLHLLFVNLDLLVHVAHDHANVARDRSQPQQLAPAIQSAFCAHTPRACSGIVIAHLQRKRRVRNHVVVGALLDARVNGDGQIPRKVHDDVAPTGSKFGRIRMSAGGDKPCGYAARSRSGLHRAINLCQIDAAIRSLQIRRPRNAREANTAAVGLGTYNANCITNVNLSASGFGYELCAGMLQRDISAARLKMGQPRY